MSSLASAQGNRCAPRGAILRLRLATLIKLFRFFLFLIDFDGLF